MKKLIKDSWVIIVALCVFAFFGYSFYRINHPKYIYHIESNNERKFLVVRYSIGAFGDKAWRFACPPEQNTIEEARSFRNYLSNHWSEYKIVE